MTTVACRRKQGEPKVNTMPDPFTCNAAGSRLCRISSKKKKMLKSLAEGGVGFLFPVIRPVLWIGL